MEQISSNDLSFETSNHFYNAHIESEGEQTIFVSLEYGRYKFNNLDCFNLQFDRVRCQSDMNTYVCMYVHIPITLFYVYFRNFDIEYFFFSDCYVIVTLRIILLYYGAFAKLYQMEI